MQHQSTTLRCIAHGQGSILRATECKIVRYTSHDMSSSWPPLQVRSEELDLGNIDGLLLLPITIEHTIDERSPLCGLTHASLQV